MSSSLANAKVHYTSFDASKDACMHAQTHTQHTHTNACTHTRTYTYMHTYNTHTPHLTSSRFTRWAGMVGVKVFYDEERRRCRRNHTLTNKSEKTDGALMYTKHTRVRKVFVPLRSNNKISATTCCEIAPPSQSILQVTSMWYSNGLYSTTHYRPTAVHACTGSILTTCTLCDGAESTRRAVRGRLKVWGLLKYMESPHSCMGQTSYSK